MTTLSLRKLLAVLMATVFLTGVLSFNAFAAVECDEDGDGYVAIPSRVMQSVGVENYNENGNYSPEQWKNFYDQYVAAEKTENETCVGLNFKKGAEPTRCDAVTLDAASNVYDPSQVSNPPRGNQVNPAAFETPDNGVDENCDGKDGNLLGNTPGQDQDLGGLVDNVVSLLGRIVVVVSIVIMIWGGVLYSTAAGDEQKTGKARKAIIGAVIGLIVGLLAPTIVNLIASNLV